MSQCDIIYLADEVSGVNTRQFTIKCSSPILDVRLLDSNGILLCRPNNIENLGNECYKLTFDTLDDTTYQLAMYVDATSNYITSVKKFTIVDGKFVAGATPTNIGELKCGALMLHPSGTGFAEGTFSFPSSFIYAENQIVVLANVTEMDGRLTEPHLWSVQAWAIDRYTFKVRAKNMFNNNGSHLKIDWIAQQV